MSSNPNKVLPERSPEESARWHFWRDLKDRVFRHVMAVGGVAVIAAIVLIFVYLLYIVAPLMKGASVEAGPVYPAPGGPGRTLLLTLDEYAEVGLRLTGEGEAVFFDAHTGAPRASRRLPGLAGRDISSWSAGAPVQRLLALGLDDGSALVLRHEYDISYPDNRRRITPRLEFPLGEAPVPVAEAGLALQALAVQGDEDQTTLVGLVADPGGAGQGLRFSRLRREVSFLDEDDVSIEREQSALALPAGLERVSALALGLDQRDLYLATVGGELLHYDLRRLAGPELVDRTRVVGADRAITALAMLSGGISLLVGDSKGTVAQWFAVRDQANQRRLAKVRDFQQGDAPITAITPEHYRKGFVALDAAGRVGLYHTTSERTLVIEPLVDGRLQSAAYSPRADDLLVLDGQGRIHTLQVDNEHPEVSWSALWGKVWYESREQAEYIWQSSSASGDFEPKLSLTPLAFGTLKGALYAMLFALPLAIMGAVYTAYFMSPALRAYVKPTVELMAALPTVILGFLAGLWLAPLIESHLPGILATLVLLPLTTVVAALLWQHLPAVLRRFVPEGWESLVLVPVILLSVWLGMGLSAPLENALFEGNMPQWLTRNLGVGFDQRNALVVGFAMGFAIIPIIFSISEDAVYGVPRHLTVGSLALGATRWQTLVRVVLLTASPGIFSGVMIGLGRAVGETMIVLMATGNTAIMDMNIFQGFRALSANIAVELPESEVASTHFRVLFLAAMVLFLITFAFNTVAELVRQRLREKYSAL